MADYYEAWSIHPNRCRDQLQPQTLQQPNLGRQNRQTDHSSNQRWTMYSTRLPTSTAHSVNHQTRPLSADLTATTAFSRDEMSPFTFSPTIMSGAVSGITSQQTATNTGPSRLGLGILSLDSTTAEANTADLTFSKASRVNRQSLVSGVGATQPESLSMPGWLRRNRLITKASLYQPPDAVVAEGSEDHPASVQTFQPRTGATRLSVLREGAVSSPHHHRHSYLQQQQSSPPPLLYTRRSRIGRPRPWSQVIYQSPQLERDPGRELDIQTPETPRLEAQTQVHPLYYQTTLHRQSSAYPALATDLFIHPTLRNSIAASSPAGIKHLNISNQQQQQHRKQRNRLSLGSNYYAAALTPSPIATTTTTATAPSIPPVPTATSATTSNPCAIPIVSNLYMSPPTTTTANNDDSTSTPKPRRMIRLPSRPQSVAIPASPLLVQQRTRWKAFRRTLEYYHPTTAETDDSIKVDPSAQLKPQPPLPTITFQSPWGRSDAPDSMDAATGSSLHSLSVVARNLADDTCAKPPKTTTKSTLSAIFELPAAINLEQQALEHNHLKAIDTPSEIMEAIKDHHRRSVTSLTTEGPVIPTRCSSIGSLAFLPTHAPFTFTSTPSLIQQHSRQQHHPHHHRNPTLSALPSPKTASILLCTPPQQVPMMITPTSFSSSKISVAPGVGNVSPTFGSFVMDNVSSVFMFPSTPILSAKAIGEPTKDGSYQHMAIYEIKARWGPRLLMFLILILGLISCLAGGLCTKSHCRDLQFCLEESTTGDQNLLNKTISTTDHYSTSNNNDWCGPSGIEGAPYLLTMGLTLSIFGVYALIHLATPISRLIGYTEIDQLLDNASIRFQ